MMRWYILCDTLMIAFVLSAGAKITVGLIVAFSMRGSLKFIPPAHVHESIEAGKVPSGIYSYRSSAGNFVQARPMLL